MHLTLALIINPSVWRISTVLRWLFDIVTLIELVEKNTCFWDKSNENNKNKLLREKCWQEIHEYLDNEFDQLSVAEKKKGAKVNKEKFKTTDEILTSKWYTGLLPDLPRHKQVKLREKKNKMPPKMAEKKFINNNNNTQTTSFPLRTHLPYPIYFSDGSNRPATKQATKGKHSNKDQAISKKKRNFRANSNNNAPLGNAYTNISESLSVEGIEKNGLAKQSAPSEKTESVENIGSSEKTKSVENIGSSEKTESVEKIGSSEKTESVEKIGSREKTESVENIGSSEKTKSDKKYGSFSESSSGPRSWEEVTSSSIQKNPTYPANIKIQESGDNIKGTAELRRSRSRMLKKKSKKKTKGNTRFYLKKGCN